MPRSKASDIVAGRFDADIRIGERLDKDVIAVRLTSDFLSRRRSDSVNPKPVSDTGP